MYIYLVFAVLKIGFMHATNFSVRVFKKHICDRAETALKNKKQKTKQNNNNKNLLFYIEKVAYLDKGWIKGFQ